MDHFSPVAPAHIRVLVLPVGQIERQRFLHVLQRLQIEASIISLADVKQQSTDDSFFLSPKAFPQGSLLYRYSAAAAPDHHQSLSPYELFREPLLVLGVVDGLHSDVESRQKELDHAAVYLKERHPRVVRRQLILLDNCKSSVTEDNVKAVAIANADTDNDVSLKAAICDVSEQFLLDLTTYAQATQVSPTILTPGQTARSLQRTTSLRDEGKRPGSGRSTPPPRLSTTTDEGSPIRSPPRAPPAPATSFDQIPSVTNPPSNGSRPDSRASDKGSRGKRSSSQDRVAIQGFGSSTSKEKVRMRGKARVGIVTGSIYMIAGQWSKALPILVEHTTKSRTLQDQLWWAKGLENILVCMLLLAWSGADFQLPSICEPVTDRSGPSHAARVAAETKAAAEGTKQQLQLFRLSLAMPDLARLITGLYRSTEGSLELPFLVVGEVSVRMSKLLAFLAISKGQFSPSTLRPIVVPHGLATSAESTSGAYFAIGLAYGKAKLAKTGIADMLAQALPSSDDGLVMADHIRLLSGIASAYALLRLDRKKAITIKDLVIRLTGALIQARKLGAAEMGIHPAASLSTETGSEAFLAIAEDSRGIRDLIADVSRTYGASLTESSAAEQPSYFDTNTFGSPNLKFDLMRELAGFCEASPDPHGALLLLTSLLRAAGPNAAVDVTPGPVHTTNAFSREEQMHLATVIHRTVAVSKHLGLPNVHATYWDPFLVRGVEILQADARKAVIDRSKISRAETATEHITPGNPLLYDPNASRPGTAEKQIFLLVENEASECVVSLQNPFDIPVDIEHLELVTEGIELRSHHEPITLGPLRFQKVSLMVTPSAVGPTKITGCRIRMQGCHTQIFPIIEQAWSAQAATTIKGLGLDARPAWTTADSEGGLKSVVGVEPDTVPVSVIAALPTLSLEAASILETGLMLLEGEKRSVSMTLRNTGQISACIFEVKDTSEILHHVSLEGNGKLEPAAKLSANTIAPTESVTFNFEIEGKAGVSHTQAAFYYSNNQPDATKYARVTTVPLEVSVNAALQAQNLEIARSGNVDGSGGGAPLLVMFDVRNAWPKSISFKCAADGAKPDDMHDCQGALAPGEIRRLNMVMPRGADEYVQDFDVVKSRFLNRLKVLWEVDERSGAVGLLGLPLSADSLLLLRGSPVEVEVSISGSSKGHKGLEFAVGSFVSVRVRLINRSKRSPPLFLRLSTDGMEGALAAERSISVVGSLQQLISPLEAGEESQVDIGLCLLLAGSLQLEATVKPMASTHGREAGSEWSEKASLCLSVS